MKQDVIYYEDFEDDDFFFQDEYFMCDYCGADEGDCNCDEEIK